MKMLNIWKNVYFWNIIFCFPDFFSFLKIVSCTVLSIRETANQLSMALVLTILLYLFSKLVQIHIMIGGKPSSSHLKT